MDVKKFIPIIPFVIGFTLIAIKVNDIVSKIGALFVIVGIVLIVIHNKKKQSTKKNNAAEYTGAYIVNPTTKVFHYPDCPTLEKLDPIKNVVLRVPRSRAISEGYKPCKKCNP